MCCETHNGCINAHKKSTTLEIIYSDQKTTLQGGTWDIEFALEDAAYDNEKVRKTAEQAGFYSSPPSTALIAWNGKMPMAGFFLSF
jgi:hypothetical protein